MGCTTSTPSEDAQLYPPITRTSRALTGEDDAHKLTTSSTKQHHSAHVFPIVSRKDRGNQRALLEAIAAVSSLTLHEQLSRNLKAQRGHGTERRRSRSGSIGGQAGVLDYSRDDQISIHQKSTVMDSQGSVPSSENYSSGLHRQRSESSFLRQRSSLNLIATPSGMTPPDDTPNELKRTLSAVSAFCSPTLSITRHLPHLAISTARSSSPIVVEPMPACFPSPYLKPRSDMPQCSPLALPPSALEVHSLHPRLPQYRVIPLDPLPASAAALAVRTDAAVSAEGEDGKGGDLSVERTIPISTRPMQGILDSMPLCPAEAEQSPAAAAGGSSLDAEEDGSLSFALLIAAASAASAAAHSPAYQTPSTPCFPSLPASLALLPPAAFLLRPAAFVESFATEPPSYPETTASAAAYRKTLAIGGGRQQKCEWDGDDGVKSDCEEAWNKDAVHEAPSLPFHHRHHRSHGSSSDMSSGGRTLLLSKGRLLHASPTIDGRAREILQASLPITTVT